MELTRGDTGQYKFQRLDADGEVITATPTAMYFTVKKSYQSSAVAFQKTIDDMEFGEDNYWHFTIDPTDTEALDIGNYVYDIEVTSEDIVSTIAKGTLKLLAEATWYTDK